MFITLLIDSINCIHRRFLDTKERKKALIISLTALKINAKQFEYHNKMLYTPHHAKKMLLILNSYKSIY